MVGRVYSGHIQTSSRVRWHMHSASFRGGFIVGPMTRCDSLSCRLVSTETILSALSGMNSINRSGQYDFTRKPRPIAREKYLKGSTNLDLNALRSFLSLLQFFARDKCGEILVPCREALSWTSTSPNSSYSLRTCYMPDVLAVSTLGLQCRTSSTSTHAWNLIRPHRQ